jgi:hypothetical protein
MITDGYDEKIFDEKKSEMIGAITFKTNVILPLTLQSANVIGG